jgi:hypothetical protein
MNIAAIRVTYADGNYEEFKNFIWEFVGDCLLLETEDKTNRIYIPRINVRKIEINTENANNPKL